MGQKQLKHVFLFSDVATLTEKSLAGSGVNDCDVSVAGRFFACLPFVFEVLPPVCPKKIMKKNQKKNNEKNFLIENE